MAIAGAPGIAASEEPDAPYGENRFVPSFSIISGVVEQGIDGSQSSIRFDDDVPQPLELRRSRVGDDNVVTPFVGGSLELMTPALPIPTRPRFFVSGEILPLFASEHQPAQEGKPSRIRGPEVSAVLAVEEDEFHHVTNPAGPRGPASDSVRRGRGQRPGHGHERAMGQSGTGREGGCGVRLRALRAPAPDQAVGGLDPV